MTTASQLHAAVRPSQQSSVPLMLSALILVFILRLLAAGIDSRFSVGASEPATMLLLAILAFSFSLNPRFSGPDSIILSGSVFFAIVVFLSHASSDISTLPGAFRLAAIFPLYSLFLIYSTEAVRQEKLLKILYRFVIFFIVIGFVLSVYHVVAGTGFVGNSRATIVRAHGTAEHPVSYGLQIILLLCVLDLIRRKQGLPASRLFWGVVLIAFASLFLTYARTAWIMAALIIGLMATQRFSLASRLLLLPVLAILAGWFLMVTGRFDDLASLPEFIANTAFDSEMYDYRFVDNSLSWRIMAWNHIVRLIMERPILGYGPGVVNEIALSGTATHNMLLEIASQTGLLGLFGFFIIMVGVALKIWRINADTSDEPFFRTQASRVAILLLIAALFGASLIYQTVTLLLFMLLISVANIPKHGLNR